MKRFRQNYPLPGGGSLIFNISLSTLGTELAPTRQRITSEKRTLLLRVKDF